MKSWSPLWQLRVSCFPRQHHCCGFKTFAIHGNDTYTHMQKQMYIYICTYIYINKYLYMNTSYINIYTYIQQMHIFPSHTMISVVNFQAFPWSPPSVAPCPISSPESFQPGTRSTWMGTWMGLSDRPFKTSLGQKNPQMYRFIYIYTRWFKVTLLSPIWRSLSHWKGHLTIPKGSLWITW